MYTVSSKYNKTIYSGDARHRLSLLFDNVEYENANTKVEYVKIKSNIFSKGGERFNLDNFVSKEVEIKIHDIDLKDIVEPINISIGTLVDDEYEYVPIGIFNLSEAPTKDGNVTTIKLRDNSIKFDVPYNAEPLINNQYVITSDAVFFNDKNYYTYTNNEYLLLVAGTDYEIGQTISGTVYQKKGSATMLQILQDICSNCGVTLETTSFINKNTEVSVWDNTVTARQHVMYIAEKAASIATISRTGELQLIPINNNLTEYKLNTNLVESFTERDKFIISRVVYEDAIRKFEYGSIPTTGEEIYPSLELYPSTEIYPAVSAEEVKQYTTLYIGTGNPYITDTTEIENIYNSIKYFSVYGLKITKILGNPALDPYDLIKFSYKDKDYITFAQSELVYNGVITQTFDTDIGTLEKAKENVTINTEEAIYKRLYTEIDQVEGDIKLVAENLEQNYYTSGQTEELVLNAATGLTNTFTTIGGANIFRNTGLWFESGDSNNPYEFWDGIVKRTKEDKAANMNALLLQNGDLSQEQTVPNGIYTVSFKYKKLIALSNLKVYINDIEYVLTGVEDTEFVTGSNNIDELIVNSQHINIRFSCDRDDGCEIYDLMVNSGSNKMAYSQNQNETTTDTVNISKGITITSTDTDTTFKANSDGIRTLDKNGNELTKFTDTGMTTKRMIVEDTSQIVGTLWQEVNNQTWITKL